MATPFLYQPAPRFFQTAAQIGHKAYLWGGRTQDFTTSGRQKLTSEIKTFDVFHEKWETKRTTGAPPPGLIDGACTTVSESMYHFGGYNDHSESNALHCLNSVTLEWTQVHSQTALDQPMRKSGCGMTAYRKEDTTSLAVFAGHGIPYGPTQPGSTFVQSTKYTRWGWTNEFHLFNLTNGMWVSLCCPPVYSSSFTHLQYGSTEGRMGVLGDLVMCMVSSRQKVDTWRVVSKSSKMILPLIVWLLEILCKLNEWRKSSHLKIKLAMKTLSKLGMAKSGILTNGFMLYLAYVLFR